MNTIDKWHHVLETKKMSELNDLLADDVVFYSPVVHTAQKGKAITSMYLSAAFQVFFNDSFTYVRQTCSDDHAVLQFTTTISGIEVNGVDMITWNEQGKIVEFKVMVRPLKAINLIHQMMKELLEKFAPGK